MDLHGWFFMKLEILNLHLLKMQECINLIIKARSTYSYRITSKNNIDNTNYWKWLKEKLEMDTKLGFQEY